MPRPTDFAAFFGMSLLAAAGSLSSVGFGIAFMATGSTACGALCAVTGAIGLLGAYRAWQFSR